MTDYPHDATVTITDDHTGKQLILSRYDFRALTNAAADGAAFHAYQNRNATARRINRIWDQLRMIAFPENVFCRECGIIKTNWASTYCDGCVDAMREAQNDMTEATMMQSGY